ncbi:hypothetical protein ISS06_00295 [Patescibacteria group bacterium]|nr:hypothetical protein [Patescibacteria group bacterium]
MKYLRLIYTLVKELWLTLIGLLLVLFILEDIQPGFVSFWVDLNLFLLIITVSGFLTLFLSRIGCQNCKK